MDNPVVASSSIYGPSSSVADYINTYGSATYDSHDSKGRSNVRGRQNTEENDPWFSDVWWNWFDWQYKKNGDDYMYDHWGTQGADGTWYFTHQDAKAAYEAWCAYMNQQGMAGMLPSYDEWLLWFMNTKGEGNAYEGSNGIYQFIPVGNVLPLLLFALLYIVVLSFKFRKTLKSSNENK